MSAHHQHRPLFNDSGTALRGSAFLQSEAKPQVLSEAKDNMVALPGQLFYSMQIPVCLWFLAKRENEAETAALAA
jgi:type I restriction-modification system DNA methylase subunit